MYSFLYNSTFLSYIFSGCFIVLVFTVLSSGRGRGRGSYQSDAPRGRFNPRNFGRGHGQDGSDREYNKLKGNGFYRPSPRQERGNSGHHQVPRNGQNLAES